MTKYEIVPLVVLALTLVILISGIVTMAIGNKFNQKYSTKLMISRVVLQALTVLAFGAVYYIQKYGV